MQPEKESRIRDIATFLGVRSFRTSVWTKLFESKFELKQTHEIYYNLTLEYDLL
jgi:hypothetical protein